ncbi:type IV-A pilus assembly ATPase PilB [Thioalkalivibrio sp. XN279]|uniref:type IV-A pilus assembly ATPase PilB n=1 Tax=Thioalkalivibrio sp. XN279 TaxID=2714953 RepID=UPI001408F3BF|nr:type IV-A pilus assembly ATPase PilB [Thioalkalivibrio sp. XN279]NHA16040.1 type IV-A pilus assembly ATPase PilB [Thioalkalivibrio sp. XN279]
MAATAQPRLTGLPRRLVQEGVINESIALEAEAEAQRSAKSSVVSYLVEKNLADPREIATAACHEFGVPVLDLDAIEVDLETARLVDEKLMHRHRVLPLFRRGRRVFLGVSDPTRLQAIDEIKFATGMSIEAIVVEDNKLDAMLARMSEALDTTLEGLGGEDIDLENLELGGEQEDSGQDVTRDEIDDAPIVRFVNKVLLDAIHKGASDIHFEPYEKFYRVRTRLDGVLKEVAKPPVTLANKVTARIKVMSRMDIAERRIPQDGRIKLKLSANRAIDFRVNTLPTLYGEKVVLRILDPSQAKLGIDALGYEDFQKQLYLDALSKPYGMILVTGPTGSGKTVSLYTGLNILNTIDRNISTAEDPAEINLPGVNQVNVNPKVGLTFASALRAFLRQDPDIIMVGEIRDLETAEIAIKAAQTGHLVLSTLHTNDAPKTLTRMVDMGVAPYAIASSVSLIIAQRLARKLCDNCKEPKEIPKEALLREGFTEAEVEEGLTIYAPVGCSKCNDGYKGRTGIFQVMPVSETIGRIIMEGGNAMQIATHAEKEGMWDLRRAGLVKVKNGITSLEEVNRVTID